MFDIDSYEQGAKDMLDAIQSIIKLPEIGGMRYDYLREHFGDNLFWILDNYTPLELIVKYKSYISKEN